MTNIIYKITNEVIEFCRLVTDLFATCLKYMIDSVSWEVKWLELRSRIHVVHVMLVIIFLKIRNYRAI